MLQPKALDELPARFRRKARVVVQSSATRLRHAPPKKTFRLCVIGHLRGEKDPLRTLAALAHVPGEVEVVQIGAPPGPEPETRSRSDPRYRWLGGLPHARALRWLASSHAMVISSRMEGGANVVCEALRIGVPVLASRISGNVGLLGGRYAGYFPLEDTRALAMLIAKARDNRAFYATLKRQVARLRPLVDPRREARALLSAVL